MATYHAQTVPILDYYKARNNLRTLNATASMKDVAAQIDKYITMQ